MERDLQPFRDLLAREGPAAMAAALSEAQKVRQLTLYVIASRGLRSCEDRAQAQA